MTVSKENFLGMSKSPHSDFLITQFKRQGHSPQHPNPARLGLVLNKLGLMASVRKPIVIHASLHTHTSDLLAFPIQLDRLPDKLLVVAVIVSYFLPVPAFAVPIHLVSAVDLVLVVVGVFDGHFEGGFFAVAPVDVKAGVDTVLVADVGCGLGDCGGGEDGGCDDGGFEGRHVDGGILCCRFGSFRMRLSDCPGM